MTSSKPTPSLEEVLQNYTDACEAFLDCVVVLEKISGAETVDEAKRLAAEHLRATQRIRSAFVGDAQEPTGGTIRAGGWREDMAWDAPANRHHEPVERRAREIYDALPYGGLGEKPAWLPGGNSTKQDEARRLARNELRSQSYTPKNTDKEA